MNLIIRARLCSDSYGHWCNLSVVLCSNLVLDAFGALQKREKCALSHLEMSCSDEVSFLERHFLQKSNTSEVNFLEFRFVKSCQVCNVTPNLALYCFEARFIGFGEVLETKYAQIWKFSSFNDYREIWTFSSFYLLVIFVQLLQLSEIW